MKSFDKEALVGVLLLALVFAAAAGLYYIKLDHERLNKQSQTESKLEAYRLETERIKAKTEDRRERNNELRLVADKGMIIDG